MRWPKGYRDRGKLGFVPHGILVALAILALLAIWFWW